MSNKDPDGRPPDDDMNSVDHAALVGEVDETYADARATAARNHALRNQLLACFLLLCLLLLALAAMQASTYCDPLVLVDCRHVRRSREVRALGWAFIIVCVYYAIALGGFGIYLAISGESWDASLVAMPSQTSTYLALVLCPGTLGVYVAYRCEIRAIYQWEILCEMGPRSVRGPSSCGRCVRLGYAAWPHFAATRIEWLHFLLVDEVNLE